MILLNKNPYQNVIDFIDVAADSREMRRWLVALERLPNNLRKNNLSVMKRRMVDNRESELLIDIVNSLHRDEILSAVNLVIQDVHSSGVRTKKYLKRFNNDNYNMLISLLSP